MSKILLKERVDFLYGFSVRVNDENVGKFPVFGSNGITGYIDTFKIKAPGIIIGRKGTVGAINFTKENFTPTDTAYYLSLKDSKQDDIKFWYYYLQLLGLNKLNTHSSVPGLSREIAYFVEVNPPDLPTQQKIASVLSALDSKIELNNRINAELEAMAKTLYDYWFVQFDFPDRDGKPYKTGGGKMVWNDELKREIPDGWEVKNLGVICDIYQPKTISEKEMISDGDFLVFGANGIVGRYDKFNHPESEIVVCCRGASCGNILRTQPKSWITGNAMVFHSTDENISSEFIYQTLNWINIKKMITGSAQPQITRTNVYLLKVIIPKPEISSKFKSFAEPIIDKQLSVFTENQQLAELRDWLLPMLMNGQVTVN